MNSEMHVHKVLINELKHSLKNKIVDICNNYQYIILELSVEPDHIHLALKIKPNIAISSVIRNIKSITGYYILKEFPELKRKYFRNNQFWTNGYYVSTIGNVSKENILKYIQSQENYD